MKEKFGSLKVGKFILKMAAPNAPNPAIPNVQGNPDQNQDQDQDQVSRRSGPSSSTYTTSTTTGPSTFGSCLVSYLFPKSFIKIG